MKKSLLLKRILLSLTVVITCFTLSKGQALLVEDFDYPNGSLLTANGWTAHSGAGTQSIDVVVPGLSFTGYPSSNIGGAAQIDNNGEDVNKTFSSQTSGVVYAAFMVKVNNPADGYFLHLGGNPIGTTFRAKLFTIGTSSPFNFGISVGSNTATPVAAGSYETGTTYLLVIKYQIESGTNNDIVSLFIFPGAIPATEPGTPTVGPLTDATQADINPGAIALRQFSANQNILVDGIRIATSWTNAISDVLPPVPTFNPANAETDVITNVTPTITFDEAVRKTDGSPLENSDLASLITFKKTDASGADVAFTATIDATKKVITVTPSANLENSQLYYLSVGPVEDASGNESNLSAITFTTISAAAPSVTLTSPAGGETMYAGSNQTITWTSANITNLLVEVWVLDGQTRTWNWISFVPSTPAAAGKVDVIVPEDALYGTEYKIRISDLDNPTVESTGGNFTIIAVATSISDLRTRCIANDIVRLNSEATVTFLRPMNRHQKYIQDTGAGLLIDDAAGILTTVVAEGDNIKGLEGKLALYGNLLEIIPTMPDVTVVSGGNSVTIPEMTLPEYINNYQMYESMLIKISDFYFTAADGSATFAASSNYTVSDGTNEVVFRTFYAGDGDVVGSVIPVPHIKGVLLAGFYNSTIQVYGRYMSDFELLTGIEDNPDKAITIYPVPVTSYLTIKNIINLKTIEILDVTGRVIKTITGNGENEITVPVNELSRGVYFLRLTTGDVKVIKKFVKS